MTISVSFMLKSATTQTLGALRGCLAKGETQARALNVEDAVMLGERLYPDMFALTRQVQMACDTAARGAARLAGQEMPSFPDTEKTFAELMSRCRKAIEYVHGIDDGAIDANTDAVLQIPIGDNTMEMDGKTYLSGFVLPNLYFHAVTAYGLLRMQGVAIGKRDFLVPS
jgi:hypothetical protein